MKCGFIVIIGRPSVGKSTLLNALCGHKVSITAEIPQTTRNAIKGIVNHPEGQIVFMDTPGCHESEQKLNLYLKDVVLRSLEDADAVLYVLDARRPPGREEQLVMDLIAKSGKPLIAAVNKTDLPSSFLPEIRGLVRTVLNPRELLSISAVSRKNLNQLIDCILEICPEGEPHYPEDFYTDQNPEFRISEIIREQAVARSAQEIPHALYVDIADMELTSAPEGPGKLWVRAFLVVERKSQAGILIGQNGRKIKEIRLSSLKEMRKIFSWKIRLDLRVKVHPKWRKKDPLLGRITGI